MVDTTRAVLAQRCREVSRPALIDAGSDRSLTWAQVTAGVAGWDALNAAYPGLRVGLAIGDPLAMASSYLAALAAGVTIAPLNPEGTPAELAAQVRAFGLRAVVSDAVAVDAAVADAVAVERGEAIVAAGCALWRPGRGGPTGWIDRPGCGVPGLPEGAALIMSSSGTTGEPKVIPVRDAQLLHSANGVARHLELDADQRGFSPLPLWHINGLVVGVLAAAVAGSSLVVGRFSRRGFWAAVATHQPTWCNLVPAMLAVLAGDEHGPVADHQVRVVRSASAPLPAAVRERFEARFGIPVVETYGMTEAASQITANPLHAPRPGSVGLPVGLDLRVVDGGGRDVAPGRTGRVEIRGASVTDVYWAAAGVVPVQRPALGDGGWLATGDVGYLDADDYLWLIGRDDDVINRGGEKVQPREVEELLAADPRVVTAVVVGRPHPTVGQEPVAYVTAHSGVAPMQLVADLERSCAASLSRFKRPASVIVLDAMPAGPTGKPRRAELRRLAANASSAVEVGAGTAAASSW